MTLLVTGGGGQLARGLVRVAGGDVVALARGALDITDPAQVAAALARYRPSVVINAAAFTQVDAAQVAQARAYAVNAAGAGAVARACAERDIAMIQLSTDHVFDGRAARPYREADPIAPVNVYGASKAAGEVAVRAAGGTVVRTAWLFGRGGPSFVHAIVRRAVEQLRVDVVADQIGSPTCVDDLAAALLVLAGRKLRSAVIHVCGDEPASRHAFAEAIVAEARAVRALRCVELDAIASFERPSLARRPGYGVLDTAYARSLGLPIGSWRAGLRALIAEEGPHL